MDTDCVIHFKDKFFIEEKKREFTEVTFKKFLDCRKEWLSLESDYKGFVTVARDSLDKVPVDAFDINQLQNKSYHISCYQLFTCLLYTSPSPRDGLLSRMPSSA